MNINLTQEYKKNRKQFWQNCPWMPEKIKIEWAKLNRNAGCYSQQLKLILLNQDILNKPGMEQATKDTLLHEMIHCWQRNHPLEIINTEPPHGKYFRTEMYRINGILEREAVTLRHDYQLPSNNKILRKAKALLAKTQSCNEYEAAIAAAKFTEYMQQYDLELDKETLAIAAELPPLVDEIVAISKRADTWRRNLLFILSKINACTLYWRKKSCVVEWRMVGRENRLDRVVLIYDYLTEAIENLVTQAQQSDRIQEEAKGRAYWNSYRVGIVNNISQRLDNDFDTRMKTGLTAIDSQPAISALVVKNWYDQETEAIKKYIKNQKYSFKTAKNATVTSSTGYHHGMEAGNAISINQQISRSSNVNKALK